MEGLQKKLFRLGTIVSDCQLQLQMELRNEEQNIAYLYEHLQGLRELEREWKRPKKLFDYSQKKEYLDSAREVSQASFDSDHVAREETGNIEFYGNKIKPLEKIISISQKSLFSKKSGENSASQEKNRFQKSSSRSKKNVLVNTPNAPGSQRMVYEGSPTISSKVYKSKPFEVFEHERTEKSPARVIVSPHPESVTHEFRRMGSVGPSSRSPRQGINSIRFPGVESMLSTSKLSQPHPSILINEGGTKININLSTKNVFGDSYSHLMNVTNKSSIENDSIIVQDGRATKIQFPRGGLFYGLNKKKSTASPDRLSASKNSSTAAGGLASSHLLKKIVASQTDRFNPLKKQKQEGLNGLPGSPRDSKYSKLTGGKKDSLPARSKKNRYLEISSPNVTRHSREQWLNW